MPLKCEPPAFPKHTQDLCSAPLDAPAQGPHEDKKIALRQCICYYGRERRMLTLSST